MNVWEIIGILLLIVGLLLTYFGGGSPAMLAGIVLILIGAVLVKFKKRK